MRKFIYTMRRWRYEEPKVFAAVAIMELAAFAIVVVLTLGLSGKLGN